MPLSRRKTLALIGGGTVLTAVAAFGGFAATRRPHNAVAPWGLAGSYDDPRLNALSFALLAPNPHNLQPWQVRLEGADALSLHRDPSRHLPETDPYDRQITIGLGCFLEQMVLAAGAAGHTVDLTLYPEGEGGAIAQAVFGQGGTPDPLSAQILDRRSCKEPFEDRSIPAGLVAQLARIAAVYTDPETVSALKELTFDAWMTETMTPHRMQESIDLMRLGKSEINASPDGIALGGPFLESLMAVGVLNRKSLADQKSTGFQEAIRMYRRMLNATPAYVALTTATNTRLDQIKAGREWLRLNLTTTALGLSLHPVSQALQEYPEMTPHYQATHALLAPRGHTVQMLGRVGYGPKIAPTPRWPIEAKLTHG
ncbi:twin-arginine translocation pathway signal protein [Sulfitobacter sp. F26204]|uniref:Acg family FMN-binding oxidoreductase n=1 Tax=Sulfitobacter sp. F26204 TaxID=2996014 RepID=UPI00225E29EF|nr:twin-arginine translocation pathway signal protein [Sulfitobacter sp. F26204]MCX7561089.1 twin-arginine translocation pathway signal protein [Sulfitobacter sp. F26204]